jgi:hypothetical protein
MRWKIEMFHKVLKSGCRVEESKRTSDGLAKLIQPRSVSNYIRKMAKLGGYLARASHPPPGNLVIWRSFSRLNDIHLGMLLSKGNLDN